MFQKEREKMKLLFVLLALLVSLALPVVGAGTITTSCLPSCAPGDTVIITGTGFHANGHDTLEVIVFDSPNPVDCTINKGSGVDFTCTTIAGPVGWYNAVAYKNSTTVIAGTSFVVYNPYALSAPETSYGISLAIADRCTRGCDELLPVASAAAEEAVRTWDPRKQTLKTWVRYLTHRRIQDYWRRHDHLTRTQRQRANRHCHECGMRVEIDMICPQCGHDLGTDLTDRERAVWDALITGRARRVLAKELGMELPTFHSTLHNVRVKLGISGSNTDVQLVNRWHEEKRKREMQEEKNLAG